MLGETNEGLSVRDLLKIPDLKEARLCGGSAGLERKISRVNVMEVPDVVQWVRPGEFLMTTGYPFRNEPEVLAPLIAQLAGKGVVALGIKTKRFIDEVPEEAVREAERHGLPLIELPPDTAFSDVVREVMERVLVQESRELSMLQSRVQRLSHVLLHGDGLPAFLHHLELLVGNPVALLDGHNRWVASPEAEPLCARLDETAWNKLRDDSVLETSIVRLEDRDIRVFASAVAEGPRPYLLLMLETNREHAAVDTLTMNWASKLVGFEISNEQARRNIEAKYIDQFLQDWIAGRIVSPVDLRLRAEACGCPLDEASEYVAGVVYFRERKPGVGELQSLARRLQWEQGEGEAEAEARWTVLNEELVCLLSRRREAVDDRDEMFRQAAKRAAQSIAKLLPPERAASVRLCLGRDVIAQERVPRSYLEARRAAEAAAACGWKEATVHYGELGVYLLLYRLLDSEEAEEFKRMYLQPLLDYDRSHQGAYVNTLRMYFECNGNVKETAERMFLHYNTVAYRLERLRAELGLRLDDADTRLKLQLAIKLGDIRVV